MVIFFKRIPRFY